MIAHNSAKDIYSWWIELFISNGLGFEESDPDTSKSVIAIEMDDDAVHLKYEPRHYFFGVDFSSGKPVLYTFVADEAGDLQPVVRKNMCGKLEFMLNNSFSNKRNKASFEKYFTLPLRADFETKKFGEKEYSGVIVLASGREEAFYSKKGVSPPALKQWKTNVFAKLNKFFEEN